MSGITYTYKISNGEYIGMYAKGGKHGEGMCIPAKTKESKNQPSAAAKADPQAERSWWETVLFGGKTGGMSACGGDGTQIDDAFKEGVPMKPPVVEPDTGTKLESGAIIVDKIVVLPVDEQGNLELPGDIFFEIEGAGRFFQETPEIELVANAEGDKPLKAKNLQNQELYIEKGTDSTYIDVDGNGVAEGVCLPGMLDVTPPTQEDQEHGFYCRETDENGEEIYKNFAVCPTNPGKRLKTFLSGYTLENYKYTGLDENEKPIYQKVGEERNILTTVNELFLDLENGLELPVVCGEAPLPIEISINPDWYSDGNLYLKLRFKIIVDARHKDKNAIYKTGLWVKIKTTQTQEE
ncbi:MAG: hypothetical protein V3T21_06000 [Candidatus Margulisiibacteriota bacterium]